MVHAGSGDVEEYIEFFHRLNRGNPGINGWGIRANRLKSDSPQNLTIEELAADYIGKTKKVQPGGPYRLAGWSIGGAIAFEMARQLEAVKDEIAFLALIDTPAPQFDLASQTREFTFTLESELGWLREILPDLATREKIKEVSDIEQLWPLIVDYLESASFDAGKLREAIPGYINRAIPNIEQLEIRESLNSINRVRTLNNARNRYIPGGKVNAVIHFFGAGETGKTYAQAWTCYCERPPVYNELQADHYTIFKMPQVEKLVNLFNTIS
ncbi:MAG: thioesterase domain-containing protein [Candidatus Aminicenantes bacterium]|nr:thioesterase domain-containing protein [Candidatus Aminicenantes bacterium]